MCFFSQERCDRGTQTVKDPLTMETERLAQDVVFFVVGRQPPRDGLKGCGARHDPGQHHDHGDVSECLRRTVTKMLEKHSLVFNSMVSRLRVDGESDLQVGFRGLCGELFCQGEVSWSKIVALFAFGARLAQHCQENHLQGMVADVVEHLASFAVENLTPFLRDNGGWVRKELRRAKCYAL